MFNSSLVVVEKSVQDAIGSGIAFSYVLVTTKYLPEITTTTQILQPLLSDSYVHPVLPTVVLMQNGLGIEEDIYAALKSHPKTVSTAMVISCAVYITASVVDDGSVSHGPFVCNVSICGPYAHQARIGEPGDRCLS